MGGENWQTKKVPGERRKGDWRKKIINKKNKKNPGRTKTGNQKISSRAGFATTTSPGDAPPQGSKIIKKQKKCKIGVCLIMFGGLSLGVLYAYFTEGVRKKQDTSVGTALLEALAGQFVYFGESDVHPCHSQARRI